MTHCQKPRLALEFGAMADPLIDQLKRQGIQHIPKQIALCQRLADHVTLLSIHHILTDAEKGRARRRIVKLIECHIREES